MKLIWHIIRKDISHHRWGLLQWALLYAAQAGLGFYMLRVDHPNLEEAAWLQWGNWLLVFLQFTTGYLLVTQFVQGDELTGTRMFWLTRPISTRRLFAAKALGVLLVFAVGPVLLLLPWWLYCGFDLQAIRWTALETLGWQLLMVAPAFLIAALTDEIGRVLMWTLLLVTGLAAWVVWVQSNLKMIVGGPVPSAGSGVLFSRLWLAAMILVAGSVIVSIHQFLTRRFVRSLIMTVPVLGLIVLVGRFWPWDCSILLTDFNKPEPPPLASGDAFAGVQLTFGPAQIRQRDQETVTNGQKVQRVLYAGILQTLEVQGMPADLVISGKAEGQFWRWPEGPADIARSLYFGSSPDRAWRQVLGLPERKEDPETTRWWQERWEKDNADRAARGLGPLPPRLRLTDGRTLRGWTRLPDSLVSRIQAQPPASGLQFEAEVGRPRILLELPIEAGARGSGESHAFRITSVFRPRESEHATVGIVLTRPALRNNGLWGVMAIGRKTQDDLPQSVMAVDRADGDWWSVQLRYGEGSEPVRAQVGGVDFRWMISGLESAQVIRDGHWVARYPDWFEHTKLVLLTTDPLARFTREVKTEKFELEPDAPGRPSSDKSF